MKKVLLTTTAIAFASSIASAGDMAMSGAIKLTYGAFGTGELKAGADNFKSEADLDIAATSASGGITMTGTLELDESGTAAGPVTISSGALTFTYDKNELGALSVTSAHPTAAGSKTSATVWDGEADSYGDYSVAFSAGGIGVTYTKDQESSDNAVAVTYATGNLTLSMTALDETTGAVDTFADAVAGDPNAGGKAAVAGHDYGKGDVKTTIGATYVTGPYTIALSGDDQTDQDWDASVAMKSGDTTITLAADETEMMSVGIAYTNGAMTVSARQEFNNGKDANGVQIDDETEISLTYTDGALTFGAAMDSGQKNHYGDEAELVINAAYVDGDVTVAAKGTDQDEMEVSVTFAF